MCTVEEAWPASILRAIDRTVFDRDRIALRVEVKMCPPTWDVAVSCEALSPDHYTMTSRESWVPVELFDDGIRAWPDGVAFIRGAIIDPVWILELAKVYFSGT
jgi:hypothetical protein